MQPLPPPNRGQSSQPSQPTNTNTAATSANPSEMKKKRKHRGGKKRRNNRRQSFAAPSEASARPSIADAPDDPLIEESQQSPSFYRQGPTSMSRESLDSEALLDHRAQPAMRPRRESRLMPTMFSSPYRAGTFPRPDIAPRRSHRSHQESKSPEDSDHDDASDRTPLLSNRSLHRSPIETGYGLFRRTSHNSTVSGTSRKIKSRSNGLATSVPRSDPTYDVNNPPSVPASPSFGPHHGDVMVDDGNFLARSLDSRRDIPPPLETLLSTSMMMMLKANRTLLLQARGCALRVCSGIVL